MPISLFRSAHGKNHRLIKYERIILLGRILILRGLHEQNEDVVILVRYIFFKLNLHRISSKNQYFRNQELFSFLARGTSPAINAHGLLSHLLLLLEK